MFLTFFKLLWPPKLSNVLRINELGKHICQIKPVELNFYQLCFKKYCLIIPKFKKSFPNIHLGLLTQESLIFFFFSHTKRNLGSDKNQQNKCPSLLIVYMTSGRVSDRQRIIVGTYCVGIHWLLSLPLNRPQFMTLCQVGSPAWTWSLDLFLS